MSRLVAPVAAIADSSASRPPNTRSPATIPPASAGSSSRNPTGRTPEAGYRVADRATSTPASPAPYSSVAWRSADRGTTRRSRTESEAARMPNRTPPRMATLSRSSIGQNERGNPSVHAGVAQDGRAVEDRHGDE